MGTAGYMSPEQARGEQLDARTDLFSFGLVLYEMATGQRAFQGDTGPVLYDAILRGKPASARKLNPAIPSKLEAVLRKALEKDRMNRYQSAEELRADLLGLTRALRSQQVIWRWLPVSLTGLALITGGMYWFESGRGSSIQPLPQIKFRQLTVNSSENPVQSGSISPDGNYLAYLDQQGPYGGKCPTAARRN